MPPRLLVVGGGPVGIAAALDAAERGASVTLLEKERVGAALQRWGGTRFFTPLRMNITAAIGRILGASAPSSEALLTGPEYVERVLEPVARGEALDGRIILGEQVVAIGRKGLTRLDFPGHPLRGERPFVILTRGAHGEKRYEADAVIDATGGYAIPAAVGSGGIPAMGEAAAASRLIRWLGELEVQRGWIAGRRILVTGHGHSAANAILILRQIAQRAPATRVTWAVRSLNRRPCAAVPNDPLPERQRVVDEANSIAEAPPPGFEILRRVGALHRTIHQRCSR